MPHQCHARYPLLLLPLTLQFLLLLLTLHHLDKERNVAKRSDDGQLYEEQNKVYNLDVQLSEDISPTVRPVTRPSHHLKCRAWQGQKRGPFGLPMVLVEIR